MKIIYLIFASIFMANLSAVVTVELNQQAIDQIKDSFKKMLENYEKQKSEAEAELNKAGLEEGKKIQLLAQKAMAEIGYKATEAYVKTLEDETKKATATATATKKPLRLTL
ncbi:hypothetical protein M1446_04170 [Candidatus Dependentiae bacterium]|nr:hypothetical protein [Candidatus Dependentiae bacterium]